MGDSSTRFCRTPCVGFEFVELVAEEQIYRMDFGCLDPHYRLLHSLIVAVAVSVAVVVVFVVAAVIAVETRGEKDLKSSICFEQYC